MRYLPSEQKEKTQNAIAHFEKTGSLTITDCNCRTPWTGNFEKKAIHTVISLKRDDGMVFKDAGTCDVYHRRCWEPCPDWQEVIKSHAADFLMKAQSPMEVKPIKW